jgi:hypothetical protein
LGTGTADELIGLDLQSISELQSRGEKPTDDASKYKYDANADRIYGKEAGCLNKQ